MSRNEPDTLFILSVFEKNTKDIRQKLLSSVGFYSKVNQIHEVLSEGRTVKKKMYEDDIKELNKWFEDKERAYSTEFNGEEYIVSEVDVEDFCDFLRELNPDLICIPCRVGTSGIWFTEKELKTASYL